MTTTPYEIRLVVLPDAAAPADELAFQAHWQSVAEQVVTRPFPLRPSLGAADLAALRWYLESYCTLPDTADRRRAADVVAQLHGWGQALFAAAFGTTQGQQAFAQLQSAAAEGRPCRITIACDSPFILQQPWELLANEGGNLALRGISVRRQPAASREGRSSLLAAPLRVLLLVSRPEEADYGDPQTSFRPLLEALGELPPGLVLSDHCEPPTLARLDDVLGQARKKQQPFHCVYLDVLATSTPQIGASALLFEDATGRQDLVAARRLGELLVRHQVPLVVLDARRVADEVSPHDAVALALLLAGVGSVVALRYAAHADALRLFAGRLFGALGGGRTVGQALAEARAALHAEPWRRLPGGPDSTAVELQDWLVPQLYQAGTDAAVLVGSVASAGDAPAPAPLDQGRLLGFPLPPRYGFHGRAHELLRLERDLRQAPAVLLAGAGGVGKTALAREAAAWWLRTGRYEAAVFVSLERRPTAERVVQLIGQTIEGEAFSPRPAEEQWRLLVEAFRARRLLLVWDRAECVLPSSQTGLEVAVQGYSADELARLLRLYNQLTDRGPKGRLLITSRTGALSWPGLKVRPLYGLARADSRSLLLATLASDTATLAYDRAECEALLALLGDHPLATELAGPLLASRASAAIRDELHALLEQLAGDAVEEFERPLRAVLAFVARHLSEGAQGLLPYLAWFAGGMLENQLRNVVDLPLDVLESLRAELAATPLVTLEHNQAFASPYWRLHPTLAFAARPADVPDPDTTERRFLGAYYAVGREAYEALYGTNPAFGMALLYLEEANYRSAIVRMFRRDERQAGGAMASTLQAYLQAAGRLRERDALMEWVRAQLAGSGGLDEAAATSIRERAWALFTQGQAAQAVETLRGLLARLENEGVAGEATAARQQALASSYLGRVYSEGGRPDLAIEPLQQAVGLFEQLGAEEQVDLSTTLGDLAGANRALGRLEPALILAERALMLDRALGRTREIATGLGRLAEILADHERYGEADASYGEALEMARQADDRDLEATTLQRRAGLQLRLGGYDQAVRLSKEALQLFQQAGDVRAEMQTCDSLGTAERARGSLDAAHKWYSRSRELAAQLNDRRHLGVVALNLGLLFQTQAAQTSDLEERTTMLQAALVAVQEGLLISRELQDHLGMAGACGQLGQLQRLLGDPTQAAAQLEEARAIYEPLDHPNLFIVYNELAHVAHAQGDVVAAAAWMLKGQAKEVALAQRGDDDAELPPLANVEPLLQAIAFVALGHEEQREEIAALLPRLEENGWQVAEATRRIWAGERDLVALAANLDLYSLAFVARALAFVADPGAPTLLPVEAEDPVPASAEALAALPPDLRAALEAGDEAAIERAFAALSPEQQMAVALALGAQAEEVDDDEEEAVEVPAEAEPLLQAIADIARGDNSQRREVEEALARIEQQGYQLGEPVRQIWAGQRDEVALTEDLDPTDRALVERILDLIGS